LMMRASYQEIDAESLQLFHQGKSESSPIKFTR